MYQTEAFLKNLVMPPVYQRRVRAWPPGESSLTTVAAVGVDGVTWHEYERNLEADIADLHGRIHRGAYRAKPSRRAWIPKADGRQRPLGIASLEDKIVQQAVLWVLQCIYEQEWWRRNRCRGDVVVVRYADDFVIGFEHRSEALVCVEELRARLAKFGLKLHDGKTRLIEFGRYAIELVCAGLGPGCIGWCDDTCRDHASCIPIPRSDFASDWRRVHRGDKLGSLKQSDHERLPGDYNEGLAAHPWSEQRFITRAREFTFGIHRQRKELRCDSSVCRLWST